MYSKQFLEALASDDKDQASAAFQATLNDKISDVLEVRKVEIASSIISGDTEMVEEEVQLDEVSAPGQEDWIKANKERFIKQYGEEKGKRILYAKAWKMAKEEFELNEGEGMDAQRKWVRQVAAVGKKYFPHGPKSSAHRQDLKKAARKYFQRYEPHGAAFVARGAEFVKDARKSAAMKEETLDEGGPTRKHFRQTAELIKAIEHPEKRKEMANHHASLYAQQNPRFDRAKFMAAAGVNEEVVSEVAQGGSVTNAQLNRNVITNLRKATQTLGIKGVNPQMAAAAHRDFGKLVSKNPKAPGYMLLRKLAANKAQQVQSLTQAGVPMGASLEAHPNDFNQALQRIKRFK